MPSRARWPRAANEADSSYRIGGAEESRAALRVRMFLAPLRVYMLNPATWRLRLTSHVGRSRSGIFAATTLGVPPRVEMIN